MAQHPTLSEFAQQVLAGSGYDIKDLQRNALGKRYTISYGMNVTETDGDKAFFTGFPIVYTGVPYSFVVAMEAAFVRLFAELNQLGREIATGGEAPPAP